MTLEKMLLPLNSRVFIFFILRYFVSRISPLLLCVTLLSCTSSRETPDAAPLQKQKPTERFLHGIAKLTSIDFIPQSIDTTIQKNYYQHLAREENEDYYSIDPLRHWFLKRDARYSQCLTSGTLGKSTSMWGFFVVKRNTSVMIPDAMIEEWQFDSHDDAVKALNEIREITNSPYIKEPFHLFSNNSCVYLLYTRAQAFTRELQEISVIMKNEIGE
jgi:hypothetical protein